MHAARFGFVDRAAQLVDRCALGRGGGEIPRPKESVVAAQARRCGQARAQDAVFLAGRMAGCAHLSARNLKPGAKVKAPALIIEPHQTIVVEAGWRAEVTPHNHVLLIRAKALPRKQISGIKADPVLLEIFNKRFMSIAEQMGVTLQNTASSVNIKERLDFSCAIFDAKGHLVANAPHMPVHLGSMDRSVETIIRANKGKIRPGDVFALNAPYNGGTHLPDITVCTPVFERGGEKRSCSGSRRAGTTPTSAASRRARCRRAPRISRKRASISTICGLSRADVPGTRRAGSADDGALSRAQPGAESADLKAQIAANAKGVANCAS